MRLGGEHKTKLNYSTYQTKFDAKMIMSVSGTVCHLILYFPVNQGLAINLPWPALKNKQCMCFELSEVFLTSSADQCFIFLLSFFVVDNLHLQIIEIISPTKHPISRLYLIIGPLHCWGGVQLLNHFVT